MILRGLGMKTANDFRKDYSSLLKSRVNKKVQLFLCENAKRLSQLLVPNFMITR